MAATVDIAHQYPVAVALLVPSIDFTNILGNLIGRKNLETQANVK